VKLSKLVTVPVVAALALPVAAVANQGHGPHTGSTGGTGSTGSTGNTGATGSHGSQGKGRCRRGTVEKGWVVAGTYGTAGTFSPTAPNADGSYTGTVSFTVTHMNRHAKGATPPFTFANAKVRFDSPTATAPAATDNVRLIGMIAVSKHGCTGPVTGTITIRKIAFSVPTS
jgi:hypothetical protein